MKNLQELNIKNKKNWKAYIIRGNKLDKQIDELKKKNEKR